MTFIFIDKEIFHIISKQIRRYVSTKSELNNVSFTVEVSKK